MHTTWLLVPLVLAICALCAAYLLAKRVGPFIPLAFVAAYVLAVGIILFINIGIFHIVDPKFHDAWVRAWLEFYWPLWTIFFAPSAISALLACWCSRPLIPSDGTALLRMYLLLILIMIEITWALDLNLVFGVGEFVILSAIFLGAAYYKRLPNTGHRGFSPLQDRRVG